VTSLVDSHGRQIKDIRISVTPRCNLHCHYCHPLDGQAPEPAGVLSLNEVENFLKAARELGAESVRFSGGEPLLRRDLPEMVTAARNIGFPDIAITTNGTLFERRAQYLCAAGLNRVNFSLDALNPEIFRQITRGGKLEVVWDSIMKALELGLNPVKINAVILRGLNDDQIVPLAELSLKYPLDIRFIEYMPLDNSDPESYQNQLVLGGEIKARLEAAFGTLEPVAADPTAPARSFAWAGAPGKVGFINPVSQPFCSHCSRLRLTADRKLRPCLLQDLELDLTAALAAGTESLRQALNYAVGVKPASGNLEPHQRTRTMLAIGG
jgi:cyclic pyranopterin phosphate synthase